MKKDELERLLAWLDPRDRKAALKSLKGFDRPRLTLYHLNALNRREEMRRREAEQTRKNVQKMYGDLGDDEDSD